MPRRTARCVVLAIACCTLIACSSPKFIYNRLDFLLPWYIDDYTDLDRQQKQFLDTRLSVFLEWHRASELPCYATLLDELDQSLARDLEAADMARLSRDIEQAWYRTQSEVLDWLLPLGEQLSEAQVQVFLGELRERQGELEEELLERSDAAFREDSYDSFVDNASDYLGRLSRAQREQVRAAMQNLVRADALWLNDRKAMIARVETLMARAPGWQARMREMVMTQADNAAPEYQRVLEHNIAVLQALTAEVLNSRTERQDQRLRRRLAKLRDDIHALVAQAQNPSSCEAPV